MENQEVIEKMHSLIEEETALIKELNERIREVKNTQYESRKLLEKLKGEYSRFDGVFDDLMK